MKSLPLVLLLAFCAQTAGDGVIYQDFRIKEFSETYFQLKSPAHAAFITPEREGLRITLSGEQPRPEPTGISARFPITGDFEMTAGYEILQAEIPKAGWGVGFEFYVRTNGPAADGTGFYRITRRGGRQVFACSRLTTDSDGKRVTPPGVDLSDKPATTNTGKLRITRIGTTAILSSAEGTSDEFDEKFRFELGSEEIGFMWLAANPGNAPNPVDMRLLDFQYRPLAKNAVQGAQAPITPPQPRNHLWWLIAILAALFIFVPLIFWLRRRRRTTENPESSPLDKKTPAGAFVVLKCPECGKKLKARTELSGKKVKCAQCGKAVLVSQETPE